MSAMSTQPYPISTEAPQQQEQRPQVPLLLLLTALVVIPIVLAVALNIGSETRVAAGVLGALAVGVILYQPYWGLIVAVALMYFRLEELIPALAGMRLTLIISATTLVGAVGHLLVKKENPIRNPINGMLIGFAGVVAFSGVLHGYALYAVEEVSKLALMVLLVVNLVRTPDRYRSFVTALILFSTYLAAFSIYRYFTGGALLEHGINRSQATGIFADPNDLAAGVIFGLGLALARLPNCRAAGRFWYGVLTLVMVVAVLLTHSRGAMLALGAVVFIFVLSLMKNKTAGVLAACVVLGALLVVAPSRMRSFDSTEESANSRFDLWLDGLEWLKENPLLGIGYRQWVEQHPTGLTAHNSFVLCFAELGLPGYFFWMGCLYYAFRRQRPEGERVELDPAIERDLFGARLALGGFLLAAFFLSRTYVQVTWLFIALAVAAQIATGAGIHSFRFAPKEQTRDWARIAALCVGSIIAIKMISHLLA